MKQTLFPILKGGIVATAAMTMLMLIAPMMGMPETPIGNMLARFMGIPVWMGWVMHFVIGAALGAGLFSANTTATEAAGFVLLFLGLGTRLISVPLIVVMIVAIFTVHIGNGFKAGNNGFEIPLYYLLMLFSLVITGPGRLSLDALIGKYIQKEEF